MKLLRPETGFSEAVYVGISEGDTVMVQTRDGERWRFQVQEIDGDTIVARGGRRFPSNDIVQGGADRSAVRKRQGTIVGTAVGTFVVLYVRAFISALGALY